MGEVGLRERVEKGAAEDEHEVSARAQGLVSILRMTSWKVCLQLRERRKTHSRVGCNRGKCGATPTNSCASGISPSSFDESPSAKRSACTGTQCVGTVGNISRVRPTTTSKSGAVNL